jgi:hypothetical protein
MPFASWFGLAFHLHDQYFWKSQALERIATTMGWNSPMQRYAWLEQEEGNWHFLTDLFADPGDSTRRWSDRFRALEELKEEGWSVVSPYPDCHESASGYGLRWIRN